LSVAINRLALAAAPRAFDALSGEIHASATTAEFETAGVLGDSLLDRMRWNAGPQAAAAKTSWWGQGLGDFGHSSQGSNAAAVGRQTYGFLMGADTMIGDTLRVGAAGGYTNLRLSIPDRASSGTIDGWVGALYGRLSLGPVRVRLGGAYADTDSRIQRSVTFPGFGDSESVKYGGSTSQVFGEVGYALDEGSIAVEPLVGAAVVRVKRDAFSESGGPAALAGSGHADDIATMTTGVKAETRMVDFDAHAMVGYRHGLRGTTPDATLSFVAGGPAFTVAGVPLEKDAAVVKAALAYRMGRDVTFDAGYTGQFGHRGRDHDVTGRLTWIY
jgi:subtilase-type serine protease